MNDQGIIEQIAQTPKCRAVQLADRLDIALEDVQASLAGLIAVGDVVSEPGTSPAGMACQLYDLSERFKASAAYNPIAVKAHAARFAAAHADLNKTERAIAFVRKHGTASSYELHVVLGLKPSDQASNYLTHAVTDGRLARDGKNWTLGSATQAPVASAAAGNDQPQPAAGIATNAAPLQQSAPLAGVPQSVPAKTGTPRRSASASRGGVAAPMTDQPGAPKANEPGVPVYRCALWSDGVLEVQKDGATVAAMEQAAGESLAAFLSRLTGERTAA
jgi:hypothetical protein